MELESRDCVRNTLLEVKIHVILIVPTSLVDLILVGLIKSHRGDFTMLRRDDLS